MVINTKSKSISNSFLFKLICRTTLFLALFLVVLISFYISGNYQNFLDSTQLFILFLCSADTIGLLLFSIAGFFVSIFRLILTGKKKYWIIIIVYFFSILGSICLFVAFRSLSILALGLQ